jgi:hypothetical protein
MMKATTRHLPLLGLTFLLLLGIGCGGDESPASTADLQAQPETAAAKLTPEKLGEIGAQIEKEPQRADEILTQHGLTRESFEREIRTVTENVDSARRYAAAYRKTT